MPITAHLVSAFQRMRTLTTPLCYAATTAIVLGIFLVRHVTLPSPQHDYPLGDLLLAVLLCGTMFDRGAGYLAVAISVVLAAVFQLQPLGVETVPGWHSIQMLVLFAIVGVTMTLIIEALHSVIWRLEEANAGLARSERARTLLLHEFRHRTRNDLNSLIGLLLLRARMAPSEAAREALREAAGHALALARVQARLTPDLELDGEAGAWVDTRDLVTGLCSDMETALAGEGLRPVALIAEAESHRLDAERAVPFGLVLNETVTNALKYAFPEDRAGTVLVRFRQDGAHFVLTVSDDGVGLPAEAELAGAPPALVAQGSGLGTRLLRALATQLRGSFTRRAGEGGSGTTAELRFPAQPPGPPPR